MRARARRSRSPRSRKRKQKVGRQRHCHSSLHCKSVWLQAVLNASHFGFMSAALASRIVAVCAAGKVVGDEEEGGEGEAPGEQGEGGGPAPETPAAKQASQQRGAANTQGEKEAAAVEVMGADQEAEAEEGGSQGAKGESEHKSHGESAGAASSGLLGCCAAPARLCQWCGACTQAPVFFFGLSTASPPSPIWCPACCRGRGGGPAGRGRAGRPLQPASRD